MIYLRSPHIITGSTGAIGDTSTLEITIDSVLAYTLVYTHFDTTTAPKWDISSLIRDYIEHNPNADAPKLCIDVDLDTVDELDDIAVDGYNLRETNTSDSGLQQDNSTIYIPNEGEFSIPISRRSGDAYYKYFYKGVEVGSGSALTVASDCTDPFGSIDSPQSYSDRVTGAGGTVEATQCYEEETNEFDIDTVKVYSDAGYTTLTNEIRIKEVEACKYPVQKIKFCNRYGVYQDLYFLRKSTKSITTSKESFKSNATALYDHQYKDFNKNGKEKMVLNSGLVDETLNDTFRDLQLAEHVWLEVDNTWLPVNVTQSSFDFKTSVNDKAFNYTIEIEFAYDKINTVW